MSVKIIFASSNRHKLDEIRPLLPPGLDLLSLDDIGFKDEIEETGRTFEENAAIKANAIFEATGSMCFADDSGLEVDALDGKPGVKSARYAGEPADHQKNVQLLLSNLQGKKNRKAGFKTIICLRLDAKTFFFEGEVKGHIVEEPRGLNGFGYDPVFVPDGHERTFAEMSMEEKNNISHRKIAVSKMMGFLKYL
jgi:XTP/dITP diphosphohydrolase